MGGRLGGAAVLAGLLAVPGLVAPAAVGAAPRAIPVDSAVPVLGQALVGALGSSEERPPTMVVTVHGVRRIEGATILYYSVGFAGEAPDPELLPVTEYGSGPGTYGTLQASAGATFMDTAAVIDVPGRRSYAALRVGQGRAPAAPAPTREEDRVRMTDRAVVQWVALAPVPQDLRTVDILVGSAFVTGVPVGDGPLLPVVDDPAPTVGAGWPRVDTLTIGGARAEGTIAELVAHVGRRAVATPSPGPTGSPTPTPTPSATPATPGPTGSPSPSAGASPSASP